MIQREPVNERDRFFLAMLRSLGIEKGKTFNPDARTTKILVDGALLGEEISKVIVNEKRYLNLYCRPDAKWQFALVVDPSQRQPDYDELDERTDWFMITKTPGVGSVHLSEYRDKDGDWLDGSKSYRLHIATPPR